MTQYPLCGRLGGPPGRSVWVSKISPPPAFFCIFVLCSYFDSNCFFVLIVLHFAFCLYLQHTIQTSIPLAGFEPPTSASDRPQTLVLDRSAIGIRNGIQSKTVQLVAVAIPTEPSLPKVLFSTCVNRLFIHTSTFSDVEASKLSNVCSLQRKCLINGSW